MGLQEISLSMRKYTKHTYLYGVDHKDDFPKLFDLLQDFLVNARHQAAYLNWGKLLSSAQQVKNNGLAFDSTTSMGALPYEDGDQP